MRADLLHVVTAVANPIRWESRIRLFRDFASHMLDSGVNLTVVECAYGERPFELADVNPAIRHVGVRAKTLVWNKECLLNIGIGRLPENWKYVAWIDADVQFRRPHWAAETVHALQQWDIVQPWSDAYDLGPHDEHMQHHVSFCRQLAHGEPVVPAAAAWWKFSGGPYDYPHSGYAWAATRQTLEWVGGLFEVGGMGAGDHHMALALVGAAENSLPGPTSAGYRRILMQWQDRAVRQINRNIGYVPGTIEHQFHGKKASRKYIERWDMFLRHRFDPDTDLKRNTWGVLELAGNKPELARELNLYFRQRDEDANTIA